MTAMLLGADPEIRALDLVERTGDVRALVRTPGQGRALTNALLKRGVIRWNRRMSRYELTRRGHRLLAEHRSPHSSPPARRGMLGRIALRISVAACLVATV